MAKIKITQTKSTIDKPENQKRVMKALGLKGLRQTVTHDDTEAIKGMINKVNHLVKVENI